jgi:hypothetical protein
MINFSTPRKVSNTVSSSALTSAPQRADAAANAKVKQEPKKRP